MHAKKEWGALCLVVAGEHGAGHPHDLGLELAQGGEEVRIQRIAVGKQAEHLVLRLLVALQINVDPSESLPHDTHRTRTQAVTRKC